MSRPKSSARRSPEVPDTRERGVAGEESLERLKRAATFLVRETLSPPGTGQAGSVVEALERREAAPRFGLTRDQALDLVLNFCQLVGVQPAYARLLRAAADVLGKKGYDATSVEDILQSADLSRRTFYQFFQGKPEVLAALLDLALYTWSSMAEAVSLEGTLDQRLRRLARVDASAFVLAGWFVRVLLGEATRPEAPSAPRFDAFIDQRAHTMRLAFEGAGHKKKGHPDARRLRAAVVGGISAISSFGLGPESNAADIGTAEDLLVAIWSAVLRDA